MRPYFSTGRIRRRAVQLLCLAIGLARTRSRISALADGNGVFKTRSVKRHPPSRQADLALLQSVTARPWDPTGSKAETDTFVFPQARRSEEATAVDPSNFQEQQQQSTEPLAPEDLQEVEDLLGDDLSGFEPEAVPPRTTFRTWSLWRLHLSSCFASRPGNGRKWRNLLPFLRSSSTVFVGIVSTTSAKEELC